MAEVKRPAFYCMILQVLRIPLEIIIKPLRGLDFIIGVVSKFVVWVVIRPFRIFGKQWGGSLPSTNFASFDTIIAGMCDSVKCHTESVYWWRKAAERGDEFAQFALANAYNRGIGVAQNDEQAIYWWRKSAESFSRAAIRLGMKYRSLGNYQQALECFLRVIERQTNEARLLLSKYQLGIIYKELNDNQAAKKWLKEASVGTQNFETDFLEKLDKKNGQEVIRFCRNAAQEALLDLTRLEEREQAKQELEDVMAMFAHKFRGPLQSIETLAENNASILEKVRIMNGLLDIFSMISINPQRLRERLLKDKRGDGNLWSVLEKNLIATFSFLLSLHQRNKIRQHYLNYAKRLGQVPTQTDLENWENECLPLERQLQAHWENSFNGITTIAQLGEWVNERFFPIEIQGVAEATLHFESYGVTESIWQIILFELLLNAIKYYASETRQPLTIRWQMDNQVGQLQVANPTTSDEQLQGKGSGKGHQFLSILARKLDGQLSKRNTLDFYEVTLSIPINLLMENDT
jgi:tetratricopeptide (TPR) repeat protein